ncbi:hypothetical protein [Acidipila sp. EB88]|uniref:hypothetical protein n=1 Tax=Acidipila sp. EB88 TaxID=2305226 RepID=UPI000F5DD229|nr:hypothetical protein [Acidipila sp. EB88]RRA50445.1 hypothetical protein D1Y84_00070 [Acidipila sp. EB88]
MTHALMVGLLVSFVFFIAIGLWNTRARSVRQLPMENWSQLAAKLKPVDRKGITVLALDYLHFSSDEITRSDEDIWKLVGGVEGLARMRDNADVLIAMAYYACKWDSDESIAVAERMRRDGIALKRAVVALGLRKICGYGRAGVSDYVQEAAMSYYLMMKRLLRLYERSNNSMYKTLTKTV